MVASTSIASMKPNAMKSTVIQSAQPLLLEGPMVQQQGSQSQISPIAASQSSTLLSTDMQYLATTSVPTHTNIPNNIGQTQTMNIQEASLGVQLQPSTSIEQVLSSGISQLSINNSQPNLIHTLASTDLMQTSSSTNLIQTSASTDLVQTPASTNFIQTPGFDNLSVSESKASEVKTLEKTGSSASSSLADFLS